MLKEPHPGIVKMKLLARSYMWWPGLDLDVERTVRTNQECAMQRKLPPVSPLHSWPWANMPMKQIHLDYAEIEGYQVLIIIDVHSKWIEAIPLRQATTATTLQALQIFFANFGLPEEIVSDNGPQFTSTDFAEYCRNKGIKHSRTPPYHPASNGAAERSVQVVKQAMRKLGTAVPLKEQLAEFLLVYRTTTHATAERRPDELFLRRTLRTRLTLIFPNLGPTVEHHQQNQKIAHDGKLPLVTFVEGEKVLVQNQRGRTKWLNGVIIRRKSPVTYLVRIAKTCVRYCHADHLLRATGVDKLPQPDSLAEPEIVVAVDESVNEDVEAVHQPTSASASLRRSSHSSQPPKRLIEEMEGH